MRRALVAAELLALVLACSAQSSRAALWAPAVTVVVEVDGGRPELVVYPRFRDDAAPGAPQRFSVDVRVLRFTLRPYPGDDPKTYAPARAYAATAASPLPARGAADDAVRLPLHLPPPTRAGMYVVDVVSGRAFVRAPSGETVPAQVVQQSRFGAVAVWWPDERNGDASLRDVRARFAHRVVHGYGGIEVGCETWSEQHGPADGVRLADVTRDTGRAALLNTGSLASSHGESAFRFLAIDPLVLQIADPRGVSYRASARTRFCDLVWRFADAWHVDTALTTAPPPALRSTTGFGVRAGMSRDEVVWRAGYPNQFGTVAAFRARDAWSYDAPTPGAWSVTFAHDRVVAVHPPGRLP